MKKFLSVAAVALAVVALAGCCCPAGENGGCQSKAQCVCQCCKDGKCCCKDCKCCGKDAECGTAKAACPAGGAKQECPKK